MSSWLSQASEILINQAPLIPDAPQALEPKAIPHEITSASTSTAPSFSKMLSTKVCYSECWIKEGSIPANKNVSVATARQKILIFGSSLASQLPKTETSSTSSSPWNLFSHQNSGEAKKALLQELTTPKSSENKGRQELALKSTQVHLESSIFKAPSQTQRSSSKKGLLQDLQKEFLPNIEGQLKTRDLKEGDQIKNAEKKKEDEPASIKALLKSLGKDASSYDQDSDKRDQQQNWFKEGKKSKEKVAKIVPIIPPPTIGIFTLSYLLTKQGILADFSAYAYHKDAINTTQEELDILHEKRLSQIKENIAKEKTIRRWGTLATIIGWIMPIIAICIGISTYSSGGGIYALLGIFAGLLELVITVLKTLENKHILDKLLPIKDAEKRQKIINNLCLGLHILALGLSLFSMHTEKLGFSPILEGSLKGIEPALGTIIAIIRGGSIWMRSELDKIKKDLFRTETHIEMINLEREDNFSRSQELLDNIEASFESLNNILNLVRELEQNHLNALRS